MPNRPPNIIFIITDQQRYGTLVACAHAVGHAPLIAAAEAEADTKLSPEALEAAKAAAGGKAKKKVRIRSSRPKLRSLIPSRLKKVHSPPR